MISWKYRLNHQSDSLQQIFSWQQRDVLNNTVMINRLTRLTHPRFQQNVQNMQ